MQRQFFTKVPKNEGNFKINKSKEGKPIETQMREQKELGMPIETGYGEIYDSKYAPGMDIRTDKMEILIDAMEKREMAKINSKQVEPEAEQTKESSVETEQGQTA